MFVGSDGFLRRVARRYVVLRRTFDALTDEHQRLVAGHTELSGRFAELADRHAEAVEANQRLEARSAELRAERDQLEATYKTWTPPGHFYSPHPDPAEIRRRAEVIFDVHANPLAVDLRDAEQVKLFDELANLVEDLKFPVKNDGEHRYFFDNPEYSWSDGIVLHAMLRHIQPRRVVEVGSGFSSMMMLDTVDGWLGGETELTFVEPYPINLRKLLRPEDKSRVTILERAVQDAPVDIFTSLEPGDLLFIDSTHVVKTGSDVNHLFFEILPRLKDGVWVHVHDIFYPFEYPREWVLEGRAWQEAYLLRAFLMFNARFEIQWYQQYMWAHHRETLLERVPLMAKNSGGNLWLRKVSGPNPIH